MTWRALSVRPYRPRADDGAGVLPGEEHRDEHAEDLVVGELGPVLVPRVDERLEHIGLRAPGLAPRCTDPS